MFDVVDEKSDMIFKNIYKFFHCWFIKMWEKEIVNVSALETGSGNKYKLSVDKDLKPLYIKKTTSDGDIKTELFTKGLGEYQFIIWEKKLWTTKSHYFITEESELFEIVAKGKRGWMRQVDEILPFPTKIWNKQIWKVRYWGSSVSSASVSYINQDFEFVYAKYSTNDKYPAKFTKIIDVLDEFVIWDKIIYKIIAEDDSNPLSEDRYKYIDEDFNMVVPFLRDPKTNEKVQLHYRVVSNIQQIDANKWKIRASGLWYKIIDKDFLILWNA